MDIDKLLVKIDNLKKLQDDIAYDITYLDLTAIKVAKCRGIHYT